ncbi:hypothetical protein ABMY47_00015 [Pseudoalteromonas sp. BZP1]|uniref:hypothetical protein n=1 Tax=unclassified Pseudoalteromonas TaxID=194690 RepID=UPI0032C3F94F
MDKVYLLEHLHIISENNECVKTIGIYASEQEAIAAVGRLKSNLGLVIFQILTPLLVTKVVSIYRVTHLVKIIGLKVS